MINVPNIDAFSSSILLLFGTLFIKFILRKFNQPNPLLFFHFYCQKLAEKVNKSTNTPNQNKISGVIATFITLLPIIIILWLFEVFIEVPWLWQGFLLYLALGSFNLTHISKSLAQALVANQYYLAKQILNPWVLRETEELSNLGLSKACIEMQLLRTLQQHITVCACYLFAGPLFALSYRLLLEMHYSWNVKRLSTTQFGLCANQLVNIIQWLPVRLFTLLLLCSAGQNTVLFWRLIKGRFFQLNNNISIHCLALILEIKLGGVAIYEGVKQRRMSFNDQARQPQATDIIHATQTIKRSILFSYFILFVIAAFVLTIGLLTSN